ncbi:hypothetical protein ABFS82_02G143300 [Erythranthe guttata]
MTSTVPPSKSQPLHNFDLPNLKWKKDGHATDHHHNHHQRRRSIKSPSRRANTSSASPVRQSPLRDSVSATPPRLQSPLGDSGALPSQDSPAHGDYSTNRSPIRGESSKPPPIREWTKRSPVVGGEPERPSLFRSQAVQESEGLRKSESASVEYPRNNSRDFAFDSIRNGVYSSTAEQIQEKNRKKSKATEIDASGTKRSKIFIKIPCKNNKLDEENPQEEPPKIDNNGEYGETCEVREEGKIDNHIDEETKTWNLRPRKPLCKRQSVNVVAEKGNYSRMPEKNKSPSPLMEAERSGEKEGDCGGEKKVCGGGGEKKGKRKLSISIALSKQEIEEDIYSLTGLKPARRPKKRAKNIQRELDFVFPGQWLVSITPDSYKVSENSLKG